MIIKHKQLILKFDMNWQEFKHKLISSNTLGGTKKVKELWKSAIIR